MKTTTRNISCETTWKQVGQRLQCRAFVDRLKDVVRDWLRCHEHDIGFEPIDLEINFTDIPRYGICPDEMKSHVEDLLKAYPSMTFESQINETDNTYSIRGDLVFQ